jgi:hypothetical protein
VLTLCESLASGHEKILVCGQLSPGQWT